MESPVETRSGELQKVSTPTALIIVDGDVLKTYINPDTELDEEDANENIRLIWDIVKNRKYYHVIVPDPSAHITLEVASYRHHDFDSVKKAEALVIKTLAHRLLAQFYLKTRKGKNYPVRIFENENDARAWFETLRSN